MEQAELEKVYFKSQIIFALKQLFQEAEDLFTSFQDEDFFVKPDFGWSPAQNLEHLSKSTSIIPIALRLPRIGLLVFGSGGNSSRDYAEIRNTYIDKLEKGAGAGVFSPGYPGESVGRKRMIDHWEKIGHDFDPSLKTWKEEELDKYRLPHPILGLISIREMLFFTMYHITRHVDNVRKKKES
ncbi:MAG: DinB family protein [Leptospiraceae bacterium]|nr:DinB family protein [Leptospiraceae bacterium]MCP5499478.1 DinB family protein [Leptospiraceae bacterium]